MRPGRLLRIAVIAVLLALAFELSRRVSEASGHTPIEGLNWALGALSMIFLLRALATEYGRGPEADLQKDVQWGVAGGLVLTILSRVV